MSLVFVVHGSNAHTWWRRLANGGYPWWRRWSSFCCELRAAFDENCRIREFRWSGGNTHQARLDAGKELARVIERESEAQPAQRIHVVGHSHGGNVALVGANIAAAGTIANLVLLANPCMTAGSQILYWQDAVGRVGRIW